MNGIIINGKTYKAVDYTDCIDCDLCDTCLNIDLTLCGDLYKMLNRIKLIMFKELKPEENTENIDNIK